jgi:predicted MPP superfamily phosphohydrolase
MYKEAHLNIVKKHEFSFSNTQLEKPLRLFFISDIHRRSIHPSIIEEVLGQVDLVIIGGDLLEKGVPLQRIEQNIQKLRSLGPIYFVWGNNDIEIEKKTLMSIYQKWGVHILKNTSTIIKHCKKEWALIGVDDLNTGNVDIDYSLQGVKEKTFKILVSHNPRVMNLIQKEQKVSLVLSGHTHGGQIRILGYGPYEKGKTHVYNGITQLISNGYGTTTLPLRLNAKPETHHIIIDSF